MNTENANRGTSASLSKNHRSAADADTRESAQDDPTDASTNKSPHWRPPNQGIARFLWEIDADTPLDQLAEAYARWSQ